jgi:molybdopterin converting factor small subunit
MKVIVKLHASLRKFSPGGSDHRVSLELPEGATIMDAARALGIPESFTGAAFIGDQKREVASALAEGQEVSLFPPIGGG